MKKVKIESVETTAPIKKFKISMNFKHSLTMETKALIVEREKIRESFKKSTGKEGTV